MNHQNEKDMGRIQTLKRLLKMIRSYWLLLSISLIFAFISVIATLYVPILIGQGVDRIVGVNQVDFDYILAIIIKLIIVVMVTNIAQWFMSLCTNKVAYHTARDIRQMAFYRLNGLPLSYIDSLSHGDILSRITTDVDQISDGLLLGFSQLFTGLITIVGTLGFMLSINVKITVIVVLITPISLLVASFIARKTFHLFNEQSAVRGDMTAYINEMIGNQKVVKAFGYEEKAKEHFAKVNEDYREVGIRALYYSAISNPSTRFVNSLVYMSVGVVGAFSVIQGQFSVGRLTSFLTYANQYTKPFNEISSVVTEFQSALASAKRVFAIIEEIPESTYERPVTTLSNVKGRVELNEVSFSYDKEKTLIEDLNLLVLPGQKIAIVGPTGCGKTTIINLLMRFYEVDQGSISVDNKKITEVAFENLRTNYGMVLQETWLRSGTIRENIAYGKPEAKMEEIIAAAKASYAHGFIERLKDGYDTIISEESTSLSEGQKQLLCIARVMLCLPPMLILDEATSSIDTRTELRVSEAFTKMMANRTSFIVAHRLSTIQNADIILVMKSGKIIEQGNHQSLMKKNGFYANLYQSQFLHIEQAVS